MKIFPILNRIWISFFCLIQTGHAQTVTPDTQTNTTVTTDASGHVTVNIAPANDDRISHNTFTRFNVPKAGLDFDNRFAGARTIISEVTGSERSLIEGNVEILGQRAHLFIANPNGILVDGARFINTGGLALSTGAIGFVERVPAPFRTQLNTTLNVTEGEILVAEGGLSGAMDTLHFLSKSLRIDGPVTNENPSAFSGIEITTGTSQAEFNSALLPLNDLSQWSTVTVPEPEDGEEPEETEAYLINISETGALRGSQISALVTDAGAGVRHAGRILADRNDFRLTVDGTILINGGETVAAGDITVDGREIIMRGTLSPPTPEDPDIPDDTGPTDTRTDFDFEPEPEISEPEVPILVGEDTDEDEDIRTDFRAIFSSSFGNVTLNATEGAMSLEAALLSSGGDMRLTTPQAFSAHATEMFSGGRMNISATEAEFISLADVFGEETMDAGRTFVAAFAPLTVNVTEGSIRIDGARLQGAIDPNADEDSDETGPAVSLVTPEDLLITSINADNLGVIFGVDGDVEITAEGNVLNHTSRIIGNGDIVIRAGGSFDNIITIPGGERDPVAQYFAGSNLAGLRTRRELRLNYGDLDIPDQTAFVTATGSVEITAGGDITNIGGHINANDGDIRLSASRITTEGIVHGNFSYQRRCFLICRASGTSSLNVAGGQISASGHLSITADTAFTNRGGFLTGLEGITLDAKEVLFESLYLPQIVDRPGGLYNFWSGHSAWIYWRDLLGGAFAGDMDITINNAETIRVRGVDLENVTSDTDITVEYTPRQVGRADAQTIGYFSDLRPLIGN